VLESSAVSSDVWFWFRSSWTVFTYVADAPSNCTLLTRSGGLVGLALDA